MDSKQCQVCGEVFRHMNGIMSHISEHSKKDIYDCLVSFKSSLEIFMKQYFALKNYVERNLNKGKCHEDEDFENSGNEESNNLNSGEMRDNSISKLDTQEMNFNSREITPTPTLNLKKISDAEQNFDNTRNINKDDTWSLKRKSESQREQHVLSRSANQYETTPLNRRLSHNLESDKNHSIKNNAIEKICGQENGDSLRTAEFENGEVGEPRSRQKINYDRGGFIDLTDIEIKEEFMDEDLAGSMTNLNSIGMGDNSFLKADTQEINPNSREITPITENCRMGRNLPVSIIDLSKRNIQQNELMDKTRQTVVREINENLKNRVLNSTGTTCLECGRIFSTKFVLRRHMMSHTGERTHACPICGKGFIGKQNMMVHLRVHTGERPYKCPYCGQHFSQYGTLYRHKKRHVAANDVKFMNCSV